MTMMQLNVLLSVLAVTGGAMAVGLAWQNARRRSTPSRLRHPTAPPPIEFVVATDDDVRPHWQVSVRSDSPATAIDIVTYRPSGSALAWVSEPIVEPIVVERGSSTLLPSVIAYPARAHDIVVAWTVRHPTGDVQGSRTITVEPVGATAVTGEPLVEKPLEKASKVGVASMVTRRDREATPADTLVFVLISIVVAALVGVGVAAWVTSGRDDASVASDSVPTTAQSGISVPSLTTVVPAPATVADETVPPALHPSTTAPPPASSAAPTTVRETTVSPTTMAATTLPTTTTPATTVPPTTVPASSGPTTTARADGRQVVIASRVEECRFGEACVIASFTLVGFPATGDYVCEFDDGSRFVFRYIGSGAEDACARSGAAPSITIEVDGVRSATVTRSSPSGP